MAISDMQRVAGNRAVARHVQRNTIQRMPSRNQAETMLPVSEKPQLVQMRTSIINMAGSYNDIISNYAKGFPKTIKEAEGGKAQKYYDKTMAELRSIIKAMTALAKQFKQAEEKSARNPFGKQKHQSRVDQIVAFFNKVDKGPPEGLLQGAHHELYMSLMAQNPKLSFLGPENKVGEDGGSVSGGVHTLGKGQMQTSQGVKTGYTKTDQAEVDDAGKGTEITHETAKQSMRSVATFKVSELLGLGVIPYTALTKSQGQTDGSAPPKVTTGQFMEEAKGVSGQGRVTGSEIDDRMYNEAQEMLRKIKDPKTPRQEKQNLKGDIDSLFGGGVKEINGKKYKMDRAAADIDWLNPVVQKDLSTLQLLDIIVAHADRHAENYIIDYDHTQQKLSGVKGIDNDSTWGKLVDKKLLEDKGSWGYQRRLKTPGLPPVIDAEVALKVLNTKFAQIKAIMEAFDLSPEEVKAAESRWEFVTEHVKTLVRAQKVATIGMDEGSQIFMYLDLFDAMGEKLPPNIDQMRLMVWGQQTGQEMTKDNSYVGTQLAQKERNLHEGISLYKPWEQN